MDNRKLSLGIAILLSAGSAPAQDLEPARKLFESRCAGCHGADGAGGEHAPSIVEASRREDGDGKSPRSLRDTIKNGIPQGGMPAFPLPELDLTMLVELLSAWRAPAANHPVSGDAARGENFFLGKGGCIGCHMVKGRGGVLGPDLSNLARERRMGQIELALRNPSALSMRGYRPVTVKLRDGRTVRGLAKNESNFDLQLQDSSGALHFFSREQIVEKSSEAQSIMPPLKATDAEMRDLLAFLTRLTSDHPLQLSIPSPPKPDGGIPFAEVVDPKPGNWPTYHGHLSGNRHSPLAEIDANNVSRLGPKWIFPIANTKRLEGTPVVVDGVMYVTTANEVFALDAARGRPIWHYSRPLTKGVIGDAASVINRGVAVLDDKVFIVTDDARMLALNRQNGGLLWETEMADYHQHYGGTSAPLAVKDLVLSGTSGGDEGARGFVDAYFAGSGKRAWRFWLVPAPGEPGSETWGGKAIEHGCVTGWLTGTYDPQTDLIYWPTGNPCPDYNGDERKGDNLYSSSVVALDPKTGKLRWYFQFTPHDLHDWDATETPMLVDAEFHGAPRKLMLQANRNGFFYVLDRVTGKFLLGQPFVHNVTWASGIGPDGRPVLVPHSEPTVEGTKTCPAVAGAANWMSTAYNPVTGLFYVMATESCAIYTKSSAWWEPGKSFYGGGARRVPGETNERFLRAIDIQTGKIAWEVPQISSNLPGGGWGGVLSTRGGLVFYCDDSGAFAAVDARNGKPLWSFQANQGWHASPMTYMVEGRQYVAVAAGSNIIAFALP
jgi:PQQ-dependent dehydrogenase (methanol/ethanol family)